MITFDMTKVKARAHDMRRARRAELFKPHDDAIALQLPNVDMAAEEQARADIRAADALVEESIDMAASVDEVKAILTAYGV